MKIYGKSFYFAIKDCRNYRTTSKHTYRKSEELIGNRNRNGNVFNDLNARAIIYVIVKCVYVYAFAKIYNTLISIMKFRLVNSTNLEYCINIMRSIPQSN